MTTIACDRCGSKHAPTSINASFEKDGDYIDLVSPFDLCGKCRLQLRKLVSDWLKHDPKAEKRNA